MKNEKRMLYLDGFSVLLNCVTAACFCRPGLRVYYGEGNSKVYEIFKKGYYAQHKDAVDALLHHLGMTYEIAFRDYSKEYGNDGRGHGIDY